MKVSGTEGGTENATYGAPNFYAIITNYSENVAVCQPRAPAARPTKTKPRSLKPRADSAAWTVWSDVETIDPEGHR